MPDEIDRVAMQAIIASLGYVDHVEGNFASDEDALAASDRALVIAHAIKELLEALMPYPAPAAPKLPQQEIPLTAAEHEFLKAVEEKRV